MPGAYDIAALAAGGAIEATKAVLQGTIANAYALTRWVLQVCSHPTDLVLLQEPAFHVMLVALTSGLQHLTQLQSQVSNYLSQ